MISFRARPAYPPWTAAQPLMGRGQQAGRQVHILNRAMVISVFRTHHEAHSPGIDGGQTATIGPELEMKHNGSIRRFRRGDGIHSGPVQILFDVGL